MKYVKMIALMVTAHYLMACGSLSESLLKNVNVRTYEDTTQDTFVEITAEVGGNNIQFPDISLPIVDAQNNNKLLGTIKLERTLDDVNLLSLSANLNEIKEANSLLDNKLPNGTSVPVSSNTSVLGFQIGKGTNKKSRFYIGGTSSQMFLGVAISLPAFDTLGNNVGAPLNIFLPFTDNNHMNGSGGIFMGPRAGQNGIALFVKMKPQADTHSLGSKKIQDSDGVEFKNQSLSGNKLYKIQYLLWQMEQKQTILLPR